MQAGNFGSITFNAVHLIRHSVDEQFAYSTLTKISGAAALQRLGDRPKTAQLQLRYCASYDTNPRSLVLAWETAATSGTVAALVVTNFNHGNFVITSIRRAEIYSARITIDLSIDFLEST